MLQNSTRHACNEEEDDVSDNEEAILAECDSLRLLTAAGSGMNASRSLRTPHVLGHGPPAEHDNLFQLPHQLRNWVCSYLGVESLPHFRRVRAAANECVKQMLAKDAILAEAFDQHTLGVNISRGKNKQVWVGVRVKPKNEEAQNCLRIKQNRVNISNNSVSRGPVDPFFFDAVFDASATQSVVWSRVHGAVLRSVLQRRHVCFMAYGQTGSGKTHTMFGEPNVIGQEGLAFRTVQAVAKYIRDSKAVVDFSFLEVYNENLYDLLADSRKLEVAGTERAVVKDLLRRRCEHDKIEEQVWQWMQEGAATRTVGKTVFNERSSRSHAVATLHIGWAENGQTESRLYLVDLAGSERAGQYALSNEQLKQGAHINNSLSTMARVVEALSTGSSKHVPYRDSILTWLLSDAFTGVNASAFMIATLHPSHHAETLNTLQYAQRYSSLRGLKNNQEKMNKLGSAIRRWQSTIDLELVNFLNALKSLNNIPANFQKPYTKERLKTEAAAASAAVATATAKALETKRAAQAATLAVAAATTAREKRETAAASVAAAAEAAAAAAAATTARETKASKGALFDHAADMLQKLESAEARLSKLKKTLKTEKGKASRKEDHLMKA
mmetsp:Transcript_96865/g.186045  ORF Transcript_96865/g.186045 Transcript_96865/m.186045 type:complete len:612 (+) Transcript_96865:100-1935(+)